MPDSQVVAVANIRALMKKRGLSSNMLADRAGLARSYVAALLGARAVSSAGEPHSMTLRSLDKLAIALDVTVAELIAPASISSD